MTVADLLIKFQQYQLDYEVLNANFAHKTAAISFMNRYGIENNVIPIDEIEKFFNEQLDKFREAAKNAKSQHEQDVHFRFCDAASYFKIMLLGKY